MDYAAKFAAGLTYEDFLARYATDEQQRRWQASFDAVRLNDSQRELLKGFRRTVHVLCMAGAWCGDCIDQCPIFEHFARESPLIRLRFIDRDANEELRSTLTICGAPRVPQTVFLNEDFESVALGGDRTLSKYRKMAAMQLGASCPTGLIIDHDLNSAVVTDWLNQFEHAHLIARLSPRLRARHGD